jgi:hypothetical protein
MNVRADILSFVDELETYAGRELNYPVEVGELLQIVIQTGLVHEFEDLIFHAKFLVSTQEVMKRIGSGADGYEQLSVEFQSNMKKSIINLNKLMERAPLEVARKLADMFIVLEINSSYRLMKLFSDLSYIKNWQIDGKPLSYETTSMVKSNYRNGSKEKMSEPLIRIQKSAISGMIILILFLFVDPPVTVIGWILSLGIAVFLVYIIIQIFLMNRTLKP